MVLLGDWKGIEFCLINGNYCLFSGSIEGSRCYAAEYFNLYVWSKHSVSKKVGFSWASPVMILVGKGVERLNNNEAGFQVQYLVQSALLL